MPEDLFVGKSNVQTYIYVFRVGEAHKKDDIVKFIDFSYDGYARSNRRKASCNLRDVDHAKERYQEIVDLVRFGKEKLNFYTTKEYYEGHIDPQNGADWNQSAPADTCSTLLDFKKIVSDYLVWEITTILRNGNIKGSSQEKINSPLDEMLKNVEWGKYKLGDLFEVQSNPQLNKDSFVFNEHGEYPYFTRTVSNNGILGYVDYLDEEHKIKGNCIAVGMLGMQFFYMEKDFYAGQFTKSIIPKNFSLTENSAKFFITILNRFQKSFQNVLVRYFESTFNETEILIPKKDGSIDFDFMENFIAQIEKENLNMLDLYLRNLGLDDQSHY